jgi:hypothetical protein
MPGRDIWISGQEAAAIISENSGHTVTPDYVRLLYKKGRLMGRPKNGRENEYSRNSAKSIIVEGKGQNRPEQAGPTVREQRARKKQEQQVEERQAIPA